MIRPLVFHNLTDCMRNLYANQLFRNNYILFIFQILDRAHSMGALNFGYVSDDGILRGSVTPFMHFSNNNNVESKQSLGQYSDHIDGYRDVAL